MKYFKITSASPNLLVLEKNKNISVINAREVTIAAHNTLIIFEETLPENESNLKKITKADKKNHKETLRTTFDTSTLIIQSSSNGSQIGYFFGDTDIILTLKDEIDHFLESDDEKVSHAIFDINIVLESIVETYTQDEEEPEPEEKIKKLKSSSQPRLVEDPPKEESENIENELLPEDSEEPLKEFKKTDKPVTKLRRKSEPKEVITKEIVTKEEIRESDNNSTAENDELTLETLFKKDPTF